MRFNTLVNRLFANKYLTFFITLVIFILCSLPSKEIPLSGSFNDKTAHFLAFGVWAFCWMGAFGKYLQTIVLGVVYGLFIEVWQWLLPESFHRGFELYDALADAIGVLLGVALWKLKTFVNV